MWRRIESGITGKELGFDYLSTIKAIADELGLVGTVFEKSDGGIKITAEGEEEDLEEFSEEIDMGDIHHPTENFYVKWEEPTREFKDFSIIDTSNQE